MMKNLVVLFLASLFFVTIAYGYQDGFDVWAYWKCDQLQTRYDYANRPKELTPDDPNAVFVGRENELMFGLKGVAAGHSTDPMVTTGLGGYFKEAIDFDGGDVAYSRRDWTDSDNFKVEMYVYPRSAAAIDTKYKLISVTDSWYLNIQKHSDGNYNFILSIIDSNSNVVFVATGNQFAEAQWYYVVIEVSPTSASISVDGTQYDIQNFSGLNPMNPGYRYMTIGATKDATSGFNGLVDEIMITDYNQQMPDYFNVYSDTASTSLLLHMDEIDFTTGPFRTPDDDSANPGRDHNGLLTQQSYVEEDYMGPELVESFATNFGNCFSFDYVPGFLQSIIVGDSSTDNLGTDSNNFQLDVWAKLDNKLNDGVKRALVRWPERLTMQVVDRTDGFWEVRPYLVDADDGELVRISKIVTEDLTNWHHYSLRYYNGELSLWIDDKFISSVSGATPSGSSEPIRKLYIGADHYRTNTWLGQIDEVRLTKAVGQCGDWGYSIADLNTDCYVNIDDLVLFAIDWLQGVAPDVINYDEFSTFSSEWQDCTDPAGQDCQPTN
jgi:hypothetical protein